MVPTEIVNPIDKESMMKKLSVILLLFIAAALLASCVELPDEPQEYSPWCKEIYNDFLISDPDYPPAFIGACVSYLQTEKSTAFVSLCGYEPFRESLEDPSINTKKDCIQYIINFEE
jgi:hypothetical protein